MTKRYMPSKYDLTSTGAWGCESCDFLSASRNVTQLHEAEKHGVCPNCGLPSYHGGQCKNCGFSYRKRRKG